MRKISIIVSALAALFLAGACQERIDELVDEEKVAVAVDVSMPEGVSTKAISDGLTASQLYYEVWSADRKIRYYKDSQALVGGKIKVEFNLVKNQTYNILFWAQDPATKYYGDVNTRSLASITMDYTTTVSNDETRDAFYNNELQDLFVDGPVTKNIDLVRPFAQVNFGTTSEDIVHAAKIGGMAPTESKVTFSVKLPTVLDLFTGAVSGETVLDYKYAAIPAVSTSGYLEVDVDKSGKVEDDEKYNYLSMNYILVSQTEKTNLDVTANIKVGGQNDVVVKAVNVPVQRNYRTNILGNLLTAPGVFNVVIDKEYKGEFNPEEILREVFAKGGTFTLHEGLAIASPLVVKAGVTASLELNGQIVENKTENKEKNVIVLEAGASLTISGTGAVTALADGCPVFTKGALVITGGTFTPGQINAEGEGSVVIKGGRFHKWDPTAYVPDGYVVSQDGDFYLVDAKKE